MNTYDEIDVDALIEHRNDPDWAPAKKTPPAPAFAETTQTYSNINNYTNGVSVPPPIHTYEEGELPMTKGHHTADPFAPREGKTLVWRDVNMTLVS